MGTSGIFSRRGRRSNRDEPGVPKPPKPPVDDGRTANNLLSTREDRERLRAPDLSKHFHVNSPLSVGMPPKAEEANERSVALEAMVHPPHLISSFEDVVDVVAQGKELSLPDYAVAVREIGELPHRERRALRDKLYEAKLLAGDPVGKPRNRYRRILHQEVVKQVARGDLPTTEQEASSAAWSCFLKIVEVDEQIKALRRTYPLSEEDAGTLLVLMLQLESLKKQRKELSQVLTAFRALPKRRLLGDSGIGTEFDLEITLIRREYADGTGVSWLRKMASKSLGFKLGTGVDLTVRGEHDAGRRLRPFATAGARAGLWDYSKVVGGDKIKTEKDRRRGELNTDYADVAAVGTNHPVFGNRTELRVPGTPVGVSVNDRNAMGLSFQFGLPRSLPGVPFPVAEAELHVFVRDPRLEPIADWLNQRIDWGVEKRDQLIEKVKRKLKEMCGEDKYNAMIAKVQKLPGL